ncbi:hypothetical protein ACOMHN_015457 [Nucella lapillus]
MESRILVDELCSCRSREYMVVEFMPQIEDEEEQDTASEADTEPCQHCRQHHRGFPVVNTGAAALYRGQGVISWAGRYIVGRALYRGQGVMSRAGRYIVGRALYRGQGVISWAGRYIVGRALYRGQGVISWAGRYIVGRALYRGQGVIS